LAVKTVDLNGQEEYLLATKIGLDGQERFLLAMETVPLLAGWESSGVQPICQRWVTPK
jgi:hypothetical protein